MDLRDKLKYNGVGRRKLDDNLFKNDKSPLRLGTYDEDEENLCHEVVKSVCQIPGCKFITDSLLDFENHYNASHRYCCCQCKKVLPSPHLLDLHIQETHDSFFAILSTKKPSYACFREDCKEKFMSAAERLDHGIKMHKIPKDFRFDQKPQTNKSKKVCNKKRVDTMEVDKEHKFSFTNSKQKVFVKYKGKKFTKDNVLNSSTVSQGDVNMDDVVEDLKQSLPK